MAKKKAKRLTKKERKAASGGGSGGAPQHLHCIACGRHLDPGEFAGASPTARVLTCDHGGRFPSCTGCVPTATTLIAEHDRSGKPVQAASAWH